MANGNFVSYIRVSTARQGESGLGLEAQQAAIRGYLNGGDWHLVEEVVEVESGKRNDRPGLAKALELCRKNNAVLLIAKLDRLARNVHFISSLMESGVEFVCIDNPQATRLVMHILAAVGEHEAKAISDRTKAALAAAKARGTKLGGFRGYVPTNSDTTAATAARSAKANASAADLGPIIADLRSTGTTSFGGIAKALNERGIPTPKGGKWQATQVQRVLARLEG